MKQVEPGLSLRYRLARSLVRALLLLFPHKVYGAENLPSGGAFILASNHACMFDGPLIGSELTSGLGRHIHYLANQNFFKLPLAGFILRETRSIATDMLNPTAALVIALDHLKRGELVGIFPEGHRSLDGKLLKAKSGAAMLALKARAPVVPIGLINTHAILPKGSAWPRFFTPYQIKIGRPMVFEQYYSEYETARDPAEIEGKVSRAIMRGIGHLIGQEYSF